MALATIPGFEQEIANTAAVAESIKQVNNEKSNVAGEVSIYRGAGHSSNRVDGVTGRVWTPCNEIGYRVVFEKSSTLMY